MYQSSTLPCCYSKPSCDKLPPFILASYLLEAQRTPEKARSSLNPPAQELPSSLVHHPSSLIPLFFSDLTPSSPHQPLLKSARSMISSEVGGELLSPASSLFAAAPGIPASSSPPTASPVEAKPHSSRCFPGQRRHLTSGGLAWEEGSQGAPRWGYEPPAIPFS